MFNNIHRYIQTRKTHYGPYILLSIILLGVLEFSLPVLLRWIAPSLAGWASTLAWLTTSIVAPAIYMYGQHTIMTPTTASISD